jgi:hypothetical protein
MAKSQHRETTAGSTMHFNPVFFGESKKPHPLAPNRFLIYCI